MKRRVLMEEIKTSNTLYSKLSNKEKEELIKYIKKVKLKYLEELSFPSNLKFGIEIETENGQNDKIVNYMKKHYPSVDYRTMPKKELYDFTNWKISKDQSLKKGIELSSPIFNDTKNTWNDIKKICDTLKRYRAKATEHTGAHIHFSASYMGENIQNFINLFKIYIIYEDILIMYGYGPSACPRPYLFAYSDIISYNLYTNLNAIKKCRDLSDLSICMSYNKNNSMNLRNVCWNNIYSENKNTIEFRSPNGTINYITWQNIINTYGHLLIASSSKDLDIEFIDYKLLHFNYNTISYDRINIDKALQLSDILFTNDYFKIMFLKQYLNNEKNHENIQNKTFLK